MGAEAKTTLRLGRQTFAGTALLETTELLFRGDTRLKLPLANITGVDVKNGSLHVTHTDGVAVFALGDAIAARWAEKIRSPRTLADKLGVKPGMEISVLDFDDAAVLAELAARGATFVHGKVAKGAAMVLWRVTTPRSVARLSTVARTIARDGAIWVIHPRGVPSVADVVIFAAAKDAGLTYTKVARISSVDTAEKLVIPRAAR